MVTQRFWSSAIYLATSNSHASGIVGPRHDHMAIIHRQAIDKQASKQASKQAGSYLGAMLAQPLRVTPPLATSHRRSRITAAQDGRKAEPEYRMSAKQLQVVPDRA